MIFCLNHIKRAVFLYFFPILFTLATTAIFTESKAQVSYTDTDYVIDYWGIEEGLPVNNVVRIIQSEQGYLWMVTYDGLVRFDGINFKVYQSDQYPGLPSNRLINLFEAPDGSLWMETEQRFVVSYKNGIFTHLGEDEGLNGSISHSMFQDADGWIWITSDNGISVYDGEELSPIKPGQISGETDRVFTEQGGAVWFRSRENGHIYRISNDEKTHLLTGHIRNFLPFFEDTNGRVWIGNGADIYFYENDTLHHYTTLDETAREVINIGQNKNDRIWISTYNNGFYELTDGKAVHFEPSSGESYSFFHSFYVDDNDNFWMFSQHNVWKNGQKTLEIPDGISSYVFDFEDNLWVGTVSEGLIRVKSNPFNTYSTPEGLPNRNVYPVMEDRSGTIWVGTHGGGVAAITNGIVDSDFHFEHPHETLYVRTLIEQSDGTILVGILAGGLFELSPGEHQFRIADQPTEIEGKSVFALYETDSTLWVGTRNGIYTLNDSGWNRYQPSGLTDIPVRFFLKAPDGAIWMATNGAGILRYQNGEFERFGINEGFESNLVRSLYIEPDSSTDQYILWAGTEDRGLVRLQVAYGLPDLQNSTIYGRNTGMLDHVIHILLEDDSGNFWFNTNRGIFTVPKSELEAYHEGSITYVKGVSYIESDGLRNREGNGGMQPAGIHASDGSIWLPGQDGVVKVDPAEINENQLLPPVIIEELETEHRTLLNHSPEYLELAVNERDFEIRFTALSLVAPDKNEFRYRLAGYNDNWIEAGGRRNAVYTNIPAGTYQFEVMASNNTGNWNPDPALITVIIAPRYYETAWFRMLMVGILILFFFAGIRWRVGAIKKREQELKKLVNKRTEQLKLEKQKTQKQADSLKELDEAKTRFFTNISHEFRTPLTLIMSPLQRMLSAEKDKFDASAQQELERMLRNSDRLLRLIDQTLELTKLEHGKLQIRVGEINLNEFVKNLTELFEPICIEKGIQLSFIPKNKTSTVFADPDKLDKIIANLLSNAIKFTPDKGMITVNLLEEGEYLLVRVEDSGIGIPKGQLGKIFERFYQVDSSETRAHEGSGVGLSLAHEFAVLHKGDLSVESEVDKGTIFTLRLKKGRDHFSADELIDLENYVIRSDKNSSTREPKSEINESNNKDRTSIMVVEDNPDLRSFICEELSGQYSVIDAANGEEALERVATELPDLIVADIMMPKMDGITFNKKLKEDPQTASIPLIFLTAKSSKENRITGLDEGADAYITKPFDPDLLKARIRNLIESRYRLRNLLMAKNGNKTSKESDPLPKDPFIEKVDEIISANFADPGFNVSKLVEQLYLDRSQVLRKLKQLTGLSPTGYIKKYRMEKASELLRQNAGTISEIAYATGFKSLSYFSYSFKEYFGVSPSEFEPKPGE